jgi:hypothetical protein
MTDEQIFPEPFEIVVVDLKCFEPVVSHGDARPKRGRQRRVIQEPWPVR